MATSSSRTIDPGSPRPGEESTPKRGFLEFPPWVIWGSVAFASLACLYDIYVSFTAPEVYMRQPQYAMGQAFIIAVLVLSPINVALSLVVALVALVVTGLHQEFLGGYPIIGITLFVLGVTRRRRWQLYFGVASVVWLVSFMATGSLPWVDASFVMAAFGFTTAIGTIIGEFRNRHAKEVSALAAQAEEARSLERRLLARELHDVVAHELTVITMQSHVMRAATAPDDVEAARTAISATAGNALGELKRLLAVMNDDTAMLRVEKAMRLSEESAAAAQRDAPGPSAATDGPMMGEDVDLVSLMDRLVGQLEAVGFTVRPQVEAGPDLPRSVQFAVSRLLREATTNVLKYGDTEVPVRMRAVVEDGEFVVDVVNGLPEIERAKVSQTGLGLTGLAERVRLLGGNLVLTTEGRTWRLYADIPLDVLTEIEGG